MPVMPFPVKMFELYILSILTLFTIGNAQDNETRLQRLQEEINVIEERLESIEEGRQGLLTQLSEIDKKIELRRRLVVELEKEVQKSTSRVQKVNTNIQVLQKNLTRINNKLKIKEAELYELKQEVGKRLAMLYKRFKRSSISFFISAENPNDFLQRRKYMQSIEDYDRRQIERLAAMKREVEESRNKLVETHNELEVELERREKELTHTRNLLAQRKNEEKQLVFEKNEKRVLLEQIQGDSELVGALLEERRQALTQIEQEIRKLDSSAPVEVESFEPQIPFANLKGNLPLPVRNARIKQSFGEIRDPGLHTVRFNPGIDFQAIPGEKVQVVAYGIVTRITYLRGFGNTIIISHGDGYRTVYARLQDIQVQEGQVIHAGHLIGSVGDSGSEQSFHFELWANRKNQNPVNWLAKF